MSNSTNYNLVAENPHSTVVGEYVADGVRVAHYQSEAELEQAFIRQLGSQAYDYLLITSEEDLIKNLRLQLEKLNEFTFTDNEWERFFTGELANPNQSIAETGDIFINTRIETHNGIESAKISITDTGSGIPEAIAHRIFEPFFTTKPIGQGTGLGLSISYGIIKNHHGTILVNSTVGKGTTFTIYLPLTGVNTHNNHPESSN